MYISNPEQFLDQIISAIQVSQSRYEEAVRTYRSLCRWFERDASTLKKWKPSTYLQGSFRLGTAIRPTTEEDEYDLDIVVQLEREKGGITQAQLKSDVGTEVKAYATSHSMGRPKNARRCWTQNYAEEARFHVDTLPAVPDPQGLRERLEARDLSTDYVDSAIAITDRTDPNYENLNPVWPVSNPKGYAIWFESRMANVLSARKSAIALREGKSVDEIPTHRAQTPLQKSIQLLKFHRDKMFADESTDKPISIIITTLAAHAYRGEGTVAGALNTILQDMDKFIEVRQGIDWVSNPTNLSENFADKWVEYPQRRANFYKWLDRVRSDLQAISAATGAPREQLLVEAFGNEVVARAFGKQQLIREGVKRKSIFALHRETPPWDVRGGGRVWIRKATWASSGSYRTNPFSSDSKPIPKHKDLRFYGRTDIPKPYEVFWQIVNTGEEAEQANCPRGGFEVGAVTSGKIMRKENTAYSGSHTIEAFIVKNGFLVARSGQFIVNIE